MNVIYYIDCSHVAMNFPEPSRRNLLTPVGAQINAVAQVSTPRHPTGLGHLQF